MRYGRWVVLIGTMMLGARQAKAEDVNPFRLALVDEPDSVYPQIAPVQPDEGVNAGAVHFDIDVSYWTRYVYRGVDQTTLLDKPENSLQFYNKAEFDLGKLPHPFIGLFVNVFNNDPVTRFEEVRPFVGADWTLKPLTISAGYNAYIFPDRKERDTQEGWLSLKLDDSRVWHSEKPVVSPYVYASYDFDLYKGFYLEAGVSHDFVIEDTGITLTPSAAIGYVISNPYFTQPTGKKAETGFQHYEIGLTASYSLNMLLNLSQRFGQFRIKGFLFYDDGINDHLRADTRLYGGGGISFEY